MNELNRRVKSIPILRFALRKVYASIRALRADGFRRSDQYWEERYQRGETSGAGSYGRLAQFKADVLNDFVKKNSISSVVEFGCGDGAQLLLSDYLHYVGFDVSETAIAMCREQFQEDSNYEFYLVDSEEYRNLPPADLTLSLDVIYHLIEDDVFDGYMGKLFSSASEYVIIYAYDFHRTYASKHEKGRKFTAWIEQNAPDWKMTRVVHNLYPFDPADPENTSQSDFFVFEHECDD